VQLTAEKEILMVFASLVHFCAIYRKLFLHHSYTMLPMYTSQ